jgi:hypothetical protein
MRSSARTPPHSQGRPAPRRPVASPAWWTQEDWSPRRFYKTMRYLFRPVRENPDSLVEIPFYLNCPVSPPVTLKALKAWFEACVGYYIEAKVTTYLTQLLDSQQGRPPQHPDPARWPDLRDLGLSRAEWWEREKALGRLNCADTRHQDTHARKRIKELAQKGPHRARTAMAKARRSILQVKMNLSWREQLVRVDSFVHYRARRQFLWIFLRKEFEWGKEPKEGKRFAKRVQELANAYAYLDDHPDFNDLTPATIAEGLRCSNQADKDAAKKFEKEFKAKGFQISAKSVRSLLSKSLRR